ASVHGILVTVLGSKSCSHAGIVFSRDQVETAMRQAHREGGDP
ncbi:Protein of unknown function, partial [Gryllus bimaculatus]